ncbi:hypothetical protein PV325_003754 [Microctonus aethiopoides]|uniref:Protein SPT2 homolog n=1 Tax=Microctonus aethiopoides TaxID=144406 RepID=A0AA39F9D7_9HYME|nr:hypothetical protein PV325_003754 [Microctonus aethiopoides]KAK0095033.1 hypothetical protein PV326_009374 [Microctonus aethiopoides]KAK0165380.1 hypothetical protein PV328_003896 [Microctonus aethiopoides]
MDFGTLLSVAQKNNVNKQSGSYYPTKFTPPKKESKQSKALSENIKRFLAKKEEEERQKALEEKQKRDNLLALRDHKAQSRINKHLKVCKAANKSVIADAVNNDDTAITMAGPSQPDEDDYGYVSQEASAFYNQLMNKYSKLPPEKPLFSDSGKRVVKDIASTKDRVKLALKQQEIEESLPHRRKRKSGDITAKESDRDSPREKNSSEKDKNIEKDDKPKAKKRPVMPPPMDFVSLLKLAEKKQHEPVVIEVKPKPKVEELERPMTKKQKKQYLKETDWKDKKDRDRNVEVPKTTNSLNELNKPTKLPVNKIPKVNHSSKPTTSIISEKSQLKPSSSHVKKIPERSVDKSASKSSVKDEILEERRKLEAEKRELESMRRLIEEEKKKLALQSKNKKLEERRPSNVPTVKAIKTNEKINKPLINPKEVKPRQFPPADVKPRQFPPSDVKPRSFPPSDVKSRSGKHSINRNERSVMSNKRGIYDNDEEESEYDSELDDFIDDAPEEGEENYSKYISEIFGYDRSKYRNFDDDDENMESNFAQQLKEEYVSTKIGIMEDLEDIRQEALEKKRKAAMMKKLKKK